MNWLFVASLAQVILGTSAVFDKLLITRHTINPYAYTFWLGVLGLFATFLLPFGFQGISTVFLMLALVSGIFFIFGIFFLYWTLERHGASETFPLIASISPIATLILGFLFFREGIGTSNSIGFIFLILGGLFLFIAEKRELRGSLLEGSCLSALFFAASIILSKVVFEHTSFVTGFFWIKMGGFLFVCAALFLPYIRQKVFSPVRATFFKSKFFYLANRSFASAGSVMVSYAISLAHPALVDATQNIRFLVIFVFAWIVANEIAHGRTLFKKIIAFFFIIIGICFLSLGEYARSLPTLPENRHIVWGVTFSNAFSTQLGLDWRKNYEAIINELKPKKLRLAAYWDEIEKNQNTFDFSSLDWELQGAGRIHADVILALGMKVPRWPECHIPEWAYNLPKEKKEEALRIYMQATIERYRHNPVIAIWQLENEPYLPYGMCPEREDDFLKKELDLVRASDSSRPILVTDGGEFGLWYKAARYGDIFGTTMYRKAYPRIIGPMLGTIEYPLSPAYFRIKEKIVRFIDSIPTKKFIVAELQAEPWGHTEINNLSYEEEIGLFSPEYFDSTITYARNTGFEEYYLWGAEWWYMLKEKNNDPRMWERAQQLFRE